MSDLPPPSPGGSHGGAEGGDGPERPGGPPGAGTSSRRLRGLAGAALLLVVIVAVVVAAALLIPGDGDTGSDRAGEADPAPTAEATAPLEAATSPEAIRALSDVLGEIDRAERSMIEFQQAVVRVRRGSPPPDAQSRVRAAAEQARAELADIRDRLTAPELGGEGLEPVRATRTAYVEHLDAWTDRLESVAENPGMALAPTPDPDAFDDINDTARVFAERLRSAVPADAPADLRSLARLILERGFSPSSGTPGGQLV